MGRDWRAWHEAYERPESSLVGRLAVVTGYLADAFDRAAPGAIRCLSLCAGDARDLAGALDRHPRAHEVRGAVVELDAALAGAASDRLGAIAPGLDVRCADATDPDVFRDVVPVDVLVLVGVFGNIADADIQRMIGAVPALCRTGATIVWSRHRRQPDATPFIRAAFAAAGCASIGFDSPGAQSFAIGVERFDGVTTGPVPESPWFAFRDDLW